MLVLVLPALRFETGYQRKILFLISMSFLFVQSMVVADVKKSWRLPKRITFIVLLIILWLEPTGVKWEGIVLLQQIIFATFLLFVVFYLFRFIKISKAVTTDVLLTSVNIYLLLGIIGASLASLISAIYADAYIFPAHISEPSTVSFFYYSFITMTTVGYGDIIPRIPESQTLSYFLAITGQLYVAIIISFLVGKRLSQYQAK